MVPQFPLLLVPTISRRYRTPRCIQKHGERKNALVLIFLLPRLPRKYGTRRVARCTSHWPRVVIFRNTVAGPSSQWRGERPCHALLVGARHLQWSASPSVGLTLPGVALPYSQERRLFQSQEVSRVEARPLYCFRTEAGQPFTLPGA